MPDAVWTGIGTFAALLNQFKFYSAAHKNVAKPISRRRQPGHLYSICPWSHAMDRLWHLRAGSCRDRGKHCHAGHLTGCADSLLPTYKLSPIQQFVLGARCGAQAAGADATIAVRDSTHGLLKAVDGAMVDLTTVAKEAVRGAILGTKAAVIKPEAAASAAPEGAIEAAREIDGRVAQRVKDGCDEISTINPSAGMP